MFAQQRQQFQSSVQDEVLGVKPRDDEEYVKWGKDNKLPQRLAQIATSNPLSMPLVNLKTDIAFGKGLILVKKIPKPADKSGGGFLYEAVADAEIEDWMESFNANDVAENCLTDWYNTGNLFMQGIRGKGMRMSTPRNFIAQIVHNDVSTVRVGTRKKGQAQAKFHYINDWINGQDSDMEKVPVWERWNEKQSKFIYHGRRYFTASPYYGLAQDIGTLEWKKLIAGVPQYIVSMMRNILSVRFIVKIPKNYWDKNGLYKGLKTEAEKKKVRQKTIDEIQAFLSGVENAGKAVTFFKDNDNYKGIEIVPVEDKTHYDAFLPNYEKGVAAVTNGYGIDPSLAGIKLEGKISNASEQHWSYRIHSLVRTAKVRSEIIKLFNYAIWTNFPWTKEQNIHVGFENIVLEALQDNKEGAKAEPTA